jgi:ankyrin repeat protein
VRSLRVPSAYQGDWLCLRSFYQQNRFMQLRFKILAIATMLSALSCSSKDKFEIWRDSDLAQVKSHVEGLTDKSDINEIIRTGEQNEFQITPLRLAVYANTADVVAYLLEQGADPKILSDVDQPILIAAVIYNVDPEVTSLLIEYGVDIHQRDEDKQSAFQNAIFNKADAQILATLIQAGAVVEPPNDSVGRREESGGSALLHAIADDGKPSVLRVLLDAGEDLEYRNPQGETALLVAARYSHRPAVIKFLVEAGANLEATTARKETALILAWH